MRFARMVAVGVCITCNACGGLLAPTDAGASIDSGDGDGNEEDSSSDFDASDAPVTPPPCSDDASLDGGLCDAPPDDTLFANPAVINVAAGSYGIAQFFAGGPWADDPLMWMAFTDSTLELGSYGPGFSPGLVLEQYGSPQVLIFQIPLSSVGQHGTVTVTGHDGNIERTAQATVNVTSCAPWSTSRACQMPGFVCGLQDDGCGGFLSCGDCSSGTYCYFGHCIGTMPLQCPSAYGFDIDSGTCVPCMACPSIDNTCVCGPGG